MHNPHPWKPIRTSPLPVEQPGILGIDEEEVEATARVLRGKRLFRYDPQLEVSEASSFEAELATYVRVPHALVVTSGTMALSTALYALGVRPGMEVIVPAYLWISVVSAVVRQGAIPVLAEVDRNFCLDPDDVRRRITPRTRGLIAVHMNGGPAEIDTLQAIAREHGLFLLEDCAQCLGGTYNGRPVGSFGDMAVFSFQANKNVSSGEGGAIVSGSDELIQRASAIHDLGIPRSNGLLQADNIPSTWGWGARMDELRAAVLRVQLRRLDATIARMRKSYDLIAGHLQNLPGIELRDMPPGAQHTGGFMLLIFESASRAQKVNQRMRELGVQGPCAATSNVLLAEYGLHIYSEISALQHKIGVNGTAWPWDLAENAGSITAYGPGSCPVSDDLFARTQMLTIPSSLSDEDERDIVQGFALALAE